MREALRKNKFIYNTYMCIKENFLCLLSLFSPAAVSRIRYRQIIGKRLDLEHPKEFNEKLMWLKLNVYNKNPLVAQCADKVRVRDYVRSLGCEEILVDKIGVYEKTEMIPWEKLPRQFVLKCNHGAGYNIICTDKQELDVPETCRKLNRWLKTDYSLKYAEVQYHKIKPLILCEKFIQPEHGNVPDDYKVYCFDGKAECIMVCQERDRGDCKFYFFDRDWNWLKWNISSEKLLSADCKKPECLDKLLFYAEKLSKGFPFVRMDFYVAESRVYFGEMTFTPCACLDQAYTELGNRELSRRLRVSGIRKK